MDKEGYVYNIERKLRDNIQLDDLEISTIMTALRKHFEYVQEPYYEVIYHDKYDNTEHRIMEPVYSRKIESVGDDYHIQEDYFDLHFRRPVRGE